MLSKHSFIFIYEFFSFFEQVCYFHAIYTQSSSLADLDESTNEIVLSELSFLEFHTISVVAIS